MARRYVQFLGARPGIVVELVDDSSSPYRLRTENDFEFFISADDFADYYRPEGSATPLQWQPFVTEPEAGLVHTDKMAEVMEVIHSFETVFQDFTKARSFLRDAIEIMGEQGQFNLQQLEKKLEERGWIGKIPDEAALRSLADVPLHVRGLLLSNTCAVIPLATGLNEEILLEKKEGAQKTKSATVEKPRQSAEIKKTRPVKMKNAEMTVDGDVLRITVDLSKEFGPSKSGKTIIVASSEGNKTVPGRAEKVGLNIYKQDQKRAAKGRRHSFKNVEMDVQGSQLVVTVDLSKDFGPSKSGKTTIVATTEGNQLVFGREEKIGLNVYRKMD